MIDIDLRLKALNRLVQSDAEAAAPALQKEFDKVTKSLDSETQYNKLEQSLDVLDVISHRFSQAAADAFLKFMQSIDTREITYSQQDNLFLSEIRKYHNATSLIVRAIESLMRLRYLELTATLHALLKLAQHTSEEVRKKALSGLETLAGYDIRVFYGDGQQQGIGATPQKQILDEIEVFQDNDLTQHFEAILVLVNGLLSPTMKGTAWSYKSFTISQGAMPALPTVADIRLRSITFLKRMYAIATTVLAKLKLIDSLNSATRTHGVGKSNEDNAKMVARDSLEVLHFYANVIPAEDLSIIQKIEHNGYWIFYHTLNEEVATAALTVRDTIAKHAEYQIYKILIGFDGIIGDWAVLKESDSSWEGADAFREEQASKYAESITTANYDEWRERILKYATTKSDDGAMFPTFFHFLEKFAAKEPGLALQLISTDTAQMENFLIPVLRSLGAGPQKDATKKLVESWIAHGRYLYQSTKQFLNNENLDHDVLASLLRRATELEDFPTIIEIMAVATSNYRSDKSFLITEFFLPALEALTVHSNTNWIYEFWFRSTARPVIQNLEDKGIDLVLRNLQTLQKIDYHAEQILYLIAENTPVKALEFLCQRVRAESQDDQEWSSSFEAIPYQLHKLNKPLSTIPAESVTMVRGLYNGNYSMFIYRGARLLKTIFPQFPKEFEAELIKILQSDGNENIEFVLAVLRNYEGELFIHQTCKEIIKLIPTDSSYRTEVAVALESTGVVSGEFGFAEAWERKKNEVQNWLNDPDEKIQEFAKWYIANLEQMSVSERKRAEEEIALRKHKYGEQE